MIKKFLLAVMLIWCATEGMAQSGELVAQNISIMNDDNSIRCNYDFYRDGTNNYAVVKKVVMEQCFLDVNIPASVKYENKDYQVVKIADNVFFENGMCSLRDPNRIIISNDATPNLIFGNNPYGGTENHPENVELIVSHCITTINEEWKSLFDVIYTPELNTFFQIIGDDGWLQADYEISYTASGCNLEPFSIKKSDITLNVEQSSILTEKDIINASENNDLIIKKATINYSDKQSCPAKIDDEGYTIYNAVNVKRADITEIKPEDLLLETNSKFYPVPNNPDAVISHVRSGNNEKNFSDDYIPCEDNGKKFIPMLGLINTDTLCVECDYKFGYNNDGVFINISIASNANIIGSYGNGNHYSSTNYNWTLKLNKDFDYSIRLTDPYPVFENKTFTDKSVEKGNSRKWEDRWFEVDDEKYNYGLFINYNKEDLTKFYDGSTNIEAKSEITLWIKQLFNPAIDAVDKLNGYMTSLENEYKIYKQIPITYTLAFYDASAGTDKDITLTITPDDDFYFYKALLGENNTVTLKGTIAPAQLSANDIAGIEAQIEESLIKTKFYDGSSEVGFSMPSQFDYTTEGELKVTVTVTEAKYYSNSAEVSDAGSGYDMKVTYEVDHNFCFNSTQTGYKYTNSVTFNGEGEITPSPSVSDDDFATAFKAKYKIYLSKTYDGTTNFLGFNPQDNVLSVTIGSATDAVAAQIKITSVAYDEKNAGSRSLKVECTPVQGSPYTISSPVTITGDDIKITPFVLDNIADYVKEDEHYKKDKTYNGYPDVEMNTPAFTIPGVTVNGTRETVEGTIAEAIYNKDGAAVSAVGDDYTITATLSIHVDDNYCFGKDNSGNYIYGNTYNIGTGSINPAKLDITFTPEDLDGKVSLTRKYNSEDASADILQSTVTKNDHTFEITSAIFTDNTPGTNKQIAITINLKDNNPNYTFDPTTVTITGGTIEKNNDEPEKIVIDKESIQQQTDQPAYCMEGVDGLTIKFAKLSGEKIKRFKIEIKGEEKLSEYMSSESEGAIPGDTIIYVHIPSDAKSGQYSGTIQFFDESGETSDKYDFTITVYKPSSMVKYLYHNVIFVDNHENLFSDYQWYKNGEKIDGATRQYYYEKVLNGNYYVVCKTNSGIKIQSCPVDGDLSAKISISSVKVYPNPAQANIPFNLELVGGNGNYAGAEMLIYNNSGNLVKHITNITDIITLTLPQGNYSGALFFNGEKTGFKIIVK